MKAVITFTFYGDNDGVSVNMNYLLNVIEPDILDKTSVDIKVFSEEELEK